MAIDVNNLAATAKLTYSDEFETFKVWDGTTGWDTKWAYAPEAGRIGYNYELEWWINEGYGPTDHINPWTVKDGVLSLTANKADPAVGDYTAWQPYTSGMINSWHDFSQQYGYFEIRAQTPAGQGLWPAFWLLRTDQVGTVQPTKPAAEIDILEMKGQDPTTLYTTAHTYTGTNGALKSITDVNKVADMSAGFHTYGMNWQKDKIEWYVDGVEVFETVTPADMHAPMFMIANLSVGGSFVGDPGAATKFPSSYNIDYIRVYEDATPTPTKTLTKAPLSATPVRTILGGTADNPITGTEKSELIDGKGGADTMTGRGGDDTYRVSQVGDTVVEEAGGGIDTVWTSITLTLGAAVENLIQGGTAKIVGTGNNLKNYMVANDAGSILKGMGGADVLVAGRGAVDMWGGRGKDTFVFNSGDMVGNGTFRVVRDYADAHDTIDLRPLFDHYAGTDPIADRYLKLAQNPRGGTDIYFDADGRGTAATAKIIAVVDNTLPSVLQLQQDVFWF